MGCQFVYAPKVFNIVYWPRILKHSLHTFADIFFLKGILLYYSRGIYTLSGKAILLKLFCNLSENESTLIGKKLLLYFTPPPPPPQPLTTTKTSIFFHFRAVFRKSVCRKANRKSTKVVSQHKMAEHLLVLFINLNKIR